MGLLKTLYKKNQYNNFYIGLDLLPAEKVLTRKSVEPYEPVQLPAEEALIRKSVPPYRPVRLSAEAVPMRKVMLGPKIPEVAEGEIKSQDEEMFEKLLITDLLRSGQ